MHRPLPLPSHRHVVPEPLRLSLASGCDCLAERHRLKHDAAGRAAALLRTAPPPPPQSTRLLKPHGIHNGVRLISRTLLPVGTHLRRENAAANQKKPRKSGAAMSHWGKNSFLANRKIYDRVHFQSEESGCSGFPFTLSAAVPEVTTGKTSPRCHVASVPSSSDDTSRPTAGVQCERASRDGPLKRRHVATGRVARRPHGPSHVYPPRPGFWSGLTETCALQCNAAALATDCPLLH